jgi:hypothetical protein
MNFLGKRDWMMLKSVTLLYAAICIIAGCYLIIISALSSQSNNLFVRIIRVAICITLSPFTVGALLFMQYGSYFPQLRNEIIMHGLLDNILYRHTSLVIVPVWCLLLKINSNW